VGIVKITDFGLSRLMKAVDDRDATVVRSVARTGKIAATPGYMSAEPSRGEAATPASHVFSFAVMLYEMLIGAQAFAGQDVLELFQEIRNVQPDRYAAEVPEPFAGAACREQCAPSYKFHPTPRLLDAKNIARIIRS
jgi:serine/threonine protein kinase